MSAWRCAASALILLALSGPVAAQGGVPDGAGTFVVLPSRQARAPWIVAVGESKLLYRLHNDGAYPVQVFTKAELEKDEPEAVVVVRPDETVDLILTGDSYYLVSPLGGEARGWFTLVEVVK